MVDTRTKTRAGNAARTASAAPGAARKGKPAGSPESKLKELKRRLWEISDLSGAGAVLGWDQATYMPKGGATARARQGATLSRLAHEKFTDPAIGRLLDGLAAFAADRPYDSGD